MLPVVEPCIQCHCFPDAPCMYVCKSLEIILTLGARDAGQILGHIFREKKSASYGP